MVKKMKLFNMYCVTWRDHFSTMDNGWTDDDDLSKMGDKEIDNFVSTVDTLGFCVKDTDKWVVMAMNRGEDKDSSCFMNILKSCILSVKEIKIK